MAATRAGANHTTDQPVPQYLYTLRNGRLAWIAARFLARLGGEPSLARIADDASWLPHAPALLHGGHVPLDVARAAADAVAQDILASAPV